MLVSAVSTRMTPQRFKQLRGILRRRQPDLTVLMENLHKPHNFSAVLRTCDAVGIYETHAVDGTKMIQTDRLTSASAKKWVKVRVHQKLEAAVDHLKGRGQRILAAHFSQSAKDFRDIDYTGPCAILLGGEKDGVSPEAAKSADEHIVIPMLGAVQSLNVSVAAAVILFEAQRQRQLAGSYDAQHLDGETFHRDLFEWSHPVIAKHLQRKQHPYPTLSDEGDIVDDFPR